MRSVSEQASPDSDQRRVEALRRLGVLETLDDGALDHFVDLAAQVFDTPAALVTVLDTDRQWYLATSGVEKREGIGRDMAFCDHTIRHRGLMVVEDTALDSRFSANPMVTGPPGVRFYAGVPLVTEDGHAVGALCVVDVRPRTVTPYQEAMLVVLAEQVMTQWELAVARRAREGAPLSTPAGSPELEHLAALVAEGAVGYVEASLDGVIESVNPAACRMLGYRADELVGTSAQDLAHPDHREATAVAFTDLAAGVHTSYEATRVYRHRTGRKVYLRCSVRRIPGVGSEPPRVVALLEDLTGRLTADTNRLIAERGRQAILGTATDAFISIDDLGAVLDWNAAAVRLFGFSAAEAVGRQLWSLIVPERSVERHRQGVVQAGRGNASSLIGVPTELAALHKDGSELLVELTLWSTPASDGKLNFHGFCRDISERVANRTALSRSHRQLTASREQFIDAFEASPTAEGIVDGQGLLVAVNGAMCRFLGCEASALLGRAWVVLLHELDTSMAGDLLAQVRETGRSVDRCEVRCLAGDERTVWGLLTMSAMRAEASENRVVIRIENIQDYKDLQSTMIRQASHDPVSGLPNRSLFVESLRQALTRPRAEAVAVGVLVVEGLGDVIDRDGYAAADAVLAQIASRLIDQLDADVPIAILQTAQFGILVPEGAARAADLARRLVAAIADPFDLPGGTVLLTGNAGISMATPSPGHEETVIGRAIQDAEAAATAARKDGAETIAFSSPAVRHQQKRRRRMELLIHEALENNRIRLDYQPVFDLTTGLIVSAEALLRVSDADGRPVPPLDLIPVAETTGQIGEIGRQVLTLAAEQSAQWFADHGTLLPVAVNVSPVQLTRPDFLRHVYAALEQAGGPPHSLSLELTESVLLEAGSTGVEKLRLLRDDGILLAIDDFGTGYASLSYLRELPATTLKIDRSFVQGIPYDPAAVAIVESVIALAKNFNMTCIAEGIETETQLTYLAERAVLGQGYLLGRPASSSVIDSMLSHLALTALPA